MQWDGYTAFSVICGIALLIWGVAAKNEKGRDRALMVLAGLGLAVYGIYVAAQTSGTYYFTIWIFVLPFLLIGKVAYGWYQRRSARD